MKTMRYQSALLVLIFVFTLFLPGFALAQEQPVLPAAYYGTVTLNGQPAPVGTIIVARIGGEVRGQITVEKAGEYGGPGDPLALKLKVNGTMEDEGKPVTFEVAGIQASETVAFKVGDVKQVKLTATGMPPGPVDTTPPTVESIDPADNEINIPVTKKIIVTFSEYVQAGDAYDAISVKDSEGNTVAVSTSIEGNILTVKPDTSFTYNTKYIFTIPAGAVKDAAGNNLAQTYVFSFTTSQAVSKVEISVPSDGKLDNFTIPPSASSVVLNQGGAQMEIPQGAFSGAAAITFKPVDNTGLPGATSIGQVFEIKIEKVTLSQPVTLRLPIPAGDRVRVFKLVGDRWVNLGGSVRDGYVEVSQNSFSLFAAANAPAPPAASPEPGSYTGSVQVTLSAESGATILYGLNAPPQNTYTEPITLTSNGTIRSVAVKDNLISDEVNFAYTVTTSASSGGGGGGGGSTTPSTNRVELPIQAGAATVAELSGVARVDVPAGAVSGTGATIAAEVKDDSLAAQAGMTLISKVVDVTLNNGTLNGQLTITLYYDKSKLAADQQPVACYYDASQGQWVRLEGRVDENAGTVAVTVDHLTTFAVFAAAKEVTPPVTFKDMQGHWAAETVSRLASMDIISGYPDGTFKPDNQITRAEATAILARALKLAPVSEQDLKFKDNAAIPEWARGVVAAAAREGLIKGYPQPDGSVTFVPGRSISRAELAAIVVRILAMKSGAPAPAELKFADTASIPDWARQSVAQVVASGIVAGYPDNTFQAERPVTRAEAAAMILRLLDKIGTQGGQ